jgi:hypothetical protein
MKWPMLPVLLLMLCSCMDEAEQGYLKCCFNKYRIDKGEKFAIMDAAEACSIRVDLYIDGEINAPFVPILAPPSRDQLRSNARLSLERLNSPPPPDWEMHLGKDSCPYPSKEIEMAAKARAQLNTSNSFK